MFEPLDGPSAQIKLTVGTAAPVEAKVSTNSLPERKVITLQPAGRMRIYFGDETTIPNAATVLANGFIHFKDAKESYEAGPKQRVWLLSESGTIDVILAERA